MTNTVKVRIAAVLTGLGVGLVACGPHDREAKRPPTREQLCVAIITANHWHAGDLCDTLSVPASKWDTYNADNGWRYWAVRGHSDCWNTAATTDEPFVICRDGWVQKP